MSIFGVNSGAGSIFQGQFESIIQQLLTIEKEDRNQLQSQQDDLDFKKESLDEVQSKLSSLLTVTESLSSGTDTNIGSLTATSTNSDAINILSSEGLTSTNSYDIEVTQLAKKDIVHSDTFLADDTSLSAGGTGSFDITIGSDGPVTITVDTTGLTDKEVLEAVSQEINDQLGDKVEAAVFQVDADNVQLSIKSLESGEENRITIDSSTGDMADLGMTDYYAANELNANFTIDGIAFERSQNIVDDAIEGISFELKGETTTKESIEVTQDVETSKETINNFIEKFNSVNSTLRSKTHVDGETNERGVLYGMRSIRNLSMNLRQIGFQQVDSLSGSGISMLSDIGIEFRQNGEMYIADEGKLDEALTSSPDQVKELFSASDGIAAQFEDRIDIFITGSDSTLSVVESGIDSQIDRLDTRIRAEERYLERYEVRIRKEYAELEQVILNGQSQMNELQNMF